MKNQHVAIAKSINNVQTISRRKILEQELINERQALETIQKSLADARAAKSEGMNQQLIKQLQEQIQDRQQNI